MIAWRVIWKAAALKTLRRLQPKLQARIIDAVDLYAATGTGDVKRLQGPMDSYRLRVGAWRVLFTRDLDALIIEVVRVGPRGDVYKD